LANSRKNILIDTCFWFALFDRHDSYHQRALALESIMDSAVILLPWPCLYETVNTKFVKNINAIKGFESLLRQRNVTFVADEPYRVAALDAVLKTAESRAMALADMVIRFIIDDENLRTDALMSFNHRDFADICRRRQIEFL